MSAYLAKVALVLAAMLSLSRSLPALAEDLAPTDKKMLILSAAGPRFGAVEVSFTAHNFSIKNNLGNSIWSDKNPDFLNVCHLENASYMKQTVRQYASDRGNHHGHSGAKRVEVKNVKLADGHTGKQTTSIMDSHRRRSSNEQKTLSVNNVKLPPAMIAAWNLIMNAPDEKDLVVDLASSKGRHEEDDSSSVSKRGQLRHQVEFRSLKLVPLQPERFTIPKNFKEAKDVGSFYFSPSGQELKKTDIDDLFRTAPK